MPVPCVWQPWKCHLENSGCLDLHEAGDAEIKGNFTSVSASGENRCILVLDKEGSLTIAGTVTGTTQFQTGSRLFPSWFVQGKAYIHADAAKAEEGNFVLPDKKVEEGYELKYENGVWSTDCTIIDDTPRVGKVDIISAPLEVDLSKIKQDQDETAIPDEMVFLELSWYDQSGEKISNETVEEYGLYTMDYVVGIKTEYWESDDPGVLEKQIGGTVLCWFPVQGIIQEGIICRQIIRLQAQGIIHFCF